MPKTASGIGMVDTADGDNRQRCRINDLLQADQWAQLLGIRFGAGRKYGTGADVIASRQVGTGQFLESGNGDPHDGLRPQDVAGQIGAGICLSQVYAFRS